MTMVSAVFVQSKSDSRDTDTPRRVVFIGRLPVDAVEGDIIQLGLPFGRMTNLIFAKKQVRCLSLWYLELQI